MDKQEKQQEYPFRPRGKHGFDREDVINYISQAQLRCNEHLARMEELEAAKSAWYTQAKNMEREKATLVARNRELEEQLERNALHAGEWTANDAVFSATGTAEAQELAAVQARCLELEQAISTANAQAQELQQTLKQERELYARVQEEKTALERNFEEQAEQAAEAMPRFNMHQQELDALRSQLDQQVLACQQYAAQTAAVEQNSATLRAENALLQEQLSALKTAKSAYDEQLPALQDELSRLTESANQITELENGIVGLREDRAALLEEKAALSEELRIARESAQANANEVAAKQVQFETLEQDFADLREEYQDLEKDLATAQQEKTQVGQTATGLQEEIARLQNCLTQAEQSSPLERGESLRSMVLASFQYSDLYVDNNLKTAQFISDATSRNLSHVNDATTSLLEQLEGISREFTEGTDQMRRNLASFQNDLGSIQSGMNRRLSQDRFKSLLDENERLRTRLETELLSELDDEDEGPPAGLLPDEPVSAATEPAAPHLPFAEDLPEDYHSILDH